MVSKELLKKLSSLQAVSGYEEKIEGVICQLFSKYCKVSTDNLGNVIALKKSPKSNGQKIMIEAHIDEIGMMVTKIDENGFLHFAPVGGIDGRILLANEVVVHGKRDLYGIVGAKPPHVLTAEEKGATVPMNKLYIDIGCSKEEAEKLVSIGDTITFESQFTELKNNIVSVKSQDDRSSVAILLSLMEDLKDIVLPFDLYFCVSVQEEVGLRGAKTAAHKINPDLAIVIDVCHSTTPDCSKDAYPFGSGAIITKGPNIYKKAVAKLLEILDEKGIKYEIDAEGGDTGTDAWVIQVTRCGVPTVLFSIPLRYMHTPVETLSMEDLDITKRAIYAFITSIDGTEDFLC